MKKRYVIFPALAAAGLVSFFWVRGSEHPAPFGLAWDMTPSEIARERTVFSAIEMRDYVSLTLAKDPLHVAVEGDLNIEADARGIRIISWMSDHDYGLEKLNVAFDEMQKGIADSYGPPDPALLRIARAAVRGYPPDVGLTVDEYISPEEGERIAVWMTGNMMIILRLAVLKKEDGGQDAAWVVLRYVPHERAEDILGY